jgi:hypothetical protein
MSLSLLCGARLAKIRYRRHFYFAPVNILPGLPEMRVLKEVKVPADHQHASLIKESKSISMIPDPNPRIRRVSVRDHGNAVSPRQRRLPGIKHFLDGPETGSGPTGNRYSNQARGRWDESARQLCDHLTTAVPA